MNSGAARLSLMWITAALSATAFNARAEAPPASSPTPNEQASGFKLKPAKGLGFGAPTGVMLYNVGVGYAWMPYPAGTEKILKPAGSKSIPISIDVAVLRTLAGHETAFGVSVGYAADFSSTSSASTTAQRLFTGVSLRQALGTNLLKGINLRLDAGYGRYLLSSDTTGTSGSNRRLRLFGGGGFSGLFGLSYSFHLRPRQRMITTTAENYYMEIHYHVSSIQMAPSVPATHVIGLTFGF